MQGQAGLDQQSTKYQSVRVVLHELVLHLVILHWAPGAQHLIQFT